MASAARVRHEQRDGVSYVCEPVECDGKQVGYAPTIDWGEVTDTTLDEIVAVFGAKQVATDAIRQQKQDAKNHVRAKYQKGVLSAKAILDAVMSGRITTTDIAKVQADQNCTMERAGSILLGVGTGTPDPEQIHWDVL